MLVFLLLLLALGQLTGPNSLGLLNWAFVRSSRLWDKHANLPLVHSVFWIFASGDGLREQCRPLKQEDQAAGADEGIAVNCRSGIGAPLVQEEPDRLLSQKIGMAAVRPEARSVEPSVEISLVPTLGQLGVFLILMLCVLVS